MRVRFNPPLHTLPLATQHALIALARAAFDQIKAGEHDMQYFGTKRIIATAMTRQEYNDYRGWTLPADESGDDMGYLVEYTDGDRSNHPNHSGYISWSPKDVFDNSYQPTDALSFGHALLALQDGYRVRRAGWNGKGMFLVFVPGSRVTLKGDTPYAAALGDGTTCTINPHIDMFTATGEMQPGWLASQTDMLATDWQIVE